MPITRLQDDNVFKPIFLDIGMLNHLAGIKLLHLDNLITAFEGALAEQFVIQELIAGSKPYHEQKLNYWIRGAKNSNAEIDCLFQIGKSVYPIEIKAGKRGTLKSLHISLLTIWFHCRYILPETSGKWKLMLANSIIRANCHEFLANRQLG